jgi:hypothetical protein
VLTKADVLADYPNSVGSYDYSHISPFENHINIVPTSGAKNKKENGDMRPIEFRYENQGPFHEGHENVIAIREKNSARVFFDHGIVYKQNTAKNERILKVVPRGQVLSENRVAQSENNMETVKRQKKIKTTDSMFKTGRKDLKDKPQLSFLQNAAQMLPLCVVVLGIFGCWRQAYATKRRSAPRKKPGFLGAVNFTSIWSYLSSYSLKFYTGLRDGMPYLNKPSTEDKLARTTKNTRRQKNSESTSWIKAAQPCAPTGLGLAPFPGSAAALVEKRIPLPNRANPLHIRDSRTEAVSLRETFGKSQANSRSSGNSTIDDPRLGEHRRAHKLNLSNSTMDRFGSALVEPCGLYNGYNSDANLCFMNSALQLIFHAVKDFGADLGRCEGAVAKAVRVIGAAAFEACRNREHCLSQVDHL